MDDRITEIRKALRWWDRMKDSTKWRPAIPVAFNAAQELVDLLDSDALIIRRDDIDYEAAAREMFGDFDVEPAVHAADLRQAQRAVDAALASSQGVEP